MLGTDVGLRLRELLRDICRAEKVTVIKGHIAKDHVHLMVLILPQVTISNLVQKLKGKSAYKLLGEFEKLRQQYWGGHLWARGYFAAAAAMLQMRLLNNIFLISFMKMMKILELKVRFCPSWLRTTLACY